MGQHPTKRLRERKRRWKRGSMAKRRQREAAARTPHQSRKMSLEHDNEARRLERIERILKELCIKMEDLHSLATLAQHRADRRVTDTKTITDRALHRKERLDRKR
jgi:hypothetical protein